MWARKLRSFLALFGIVWGASTVILLLALGVGFKNAGQNEMMQLVDGTLFVIHKSLVSWFSKREKNKYKIELSIIVFILPVKSFTEF